MNFRGRQRDTDPDINLIPLIDVLLVIVIFVMLTTTWNRLTEININLPFADAQKASEKNRMVVLVVSAQGAYSINKVPVPARNAQALAAALTAVVENDARLIISADALASHQSVVHAMEAARLAGLSRITFATQAIR